MRGMGGLGGPGAHSAHPHPQPPLLLLESNLQREESGSILEHVAAAEDKIRGEARLVVPSTRLGWPLLCSFPR